MKKLIALLIGCAVLALLSEAFGQLPIGTVRVPITTDGTNVVYPTLIVFTNGASFSKNVTLNGFTNSDGGVFQSGNVVIGTNNAAGTFAVNVAMISTDPIVTSTNLQAQYATFTTNMGAANSAVRNADFSSSGSTVVTNLTGLGFITNQQVNVTLPSLKTTGLTNTLGFFLGGSGQIGTNGSASVFTINAHPVINGTLTNNGGGFFSGSMTFGTNNSASIFTVNMKPNFTQGFTVETSNGSPNEVAIDATNCIMRFFGTAGISLPHAALSHTNTLSSLGTTAANYVPFNVNEDVDPAITHVAGSSNIVFNTPGTYELIASVVALASGPGKHADFWFTLNGTNIPRSDTYITMPSAAGNVIAVAVQYPFASNDVVQILWASDDDAGFTLPATTNKFNPTRPVSPSVILSIKQVSKD